jgi:hypothetical protein
VPAAGSCRGQECYVYRPFQSAVASMGRFVAYIAEIVAAVETGDCKIAEAIVEAPVAAYAVEGPAVQCSGKMGSIAGVAAVPAVEVVADIHYHRTPGRFAAA